MPFADVGPIVVPEELTDEQVLFLSDVLPTGWMAAECCDIVPGDTVAIWGCGPIGLIAARSAFLLGAERVIAIDHFPERLVLARTLGAQTLDYEEVDVIDALRDLTGGIGPDAVIDAVGTESHAPGVIYALDRAKQAMMEMDRPQVLREAITAVRNGGRLSVIGTYMGLADKIPIGSLMNRSITVKTGQAHVQRYMRMLLERIQRQEIDPTFIITHRMPLEEAPRAYEMFKKKEDGCVKVVLKAARLSRRIISRARSRSSSECARRCSEQRPPR